MASKKPLLDAIKVFKDEMKYYNRNFVQEYKFHPKRKWRFDFADLENKIAVEIEGGVYTRGRHVRPVGYVRDMEKYNYATIMGWRVLRFTPEQIRSGKYLKILDMAYEQNTSGT